MKSYCKVALVLLAAVFCTAGVAYAEAVEGVVASVDLEGKALKITKTDAATGAQEEVSVTVDDATTYSGEVTALEEVIEGDNVKLEAEKDAAGNWVAKSVDVSVEEEAGAEEGTAEHAGQEHGGEAKT